MTERNFTFGVAQQTKTHYLAFESNYYCAINLNVYYKVFFDNLTLGNCLLNIYMLQKSITYIQMEILTVK